MKAKSIKGNSPSAIKIALEQGMADGFKPTLAVVFLSVKQSRDVVCKILDDGGIAIYGATTNGEFTEEGISAGEIAILLLDINPAYFTILFEEFPEENYRETTQAIAKKALKTFAHPCFLIAGSNLNTDAEELLRGFEDIIGKQVNVFGAMAGDDFVFKETFVFTNGKISNRGVVAIALDEGKIMIKGRATCGWNAVGTAKTITKSIGNRVYTIDNVPALDITAKYGGLTNVTKENTGLIAEIATSLPLQLQRENGAPVMRPCFEIDWEDHSFLCSGAMPQGSKVRFSLPPDFDVIEKVIAACVDMKETEIPEADAVIVFNCGGRFFALGPLIGKEIEGIQKIWNVPMVGFFSNAELARATDGNLEMHNITTCCVALKEK